MLGVLGNFVGSITEILNEQYGEVDVKFSFGFHEIDSFLEAGDLILSEKGMTTAISEKRTGMQRALALSLIQLYARKINEDGGLKRNR